MTHTITTSKGSFLLVEISDTDKVEIRYPHGETSLFINDEYFKTLPANSEFFATTKDITEDQAKEVVDEKNIQSVAHTWGTKAAGYVHYGNESMFWHTAI